MRKKSKFNKSQNRLIPLSLPETFKRIYYYLYTNSNIPRAERLGAEMIRILFCKIYDELYNKKSSLFTMHPQDNAEKASGRIKALFKKVKIEFSEVFEKEERLHLDNKSVAYVVETLQNHKLLETNRDVVGEAFQAFWDSGLRGEKGQFFTPKNVVKMCVKILNPKPNEKIIDPACGSGGFLVECITHLNSIANKREVFSNIFGIDREIDLAKICKAYMSIIGDGHTNIYCSDSLDTELWLESMKNGIKNETFDIVLTNPPFGVKISIYDKEILKKYKLGYKWEKTDQSIWQITDKILIKQSPQVLFIERCLQLLKPGGRMAIVLPDGLFGNSSDKYIFQYILQEAKLLKVVSLSHEAFMPSTHTKTSVLFLEKRKQKKIEEDYEISMAIANKMGHDKNGKLIYKMDKRGNYILNSRKEKMIDDDLPIIGNHFKFFRKNKLRKFNHLGFSIKLSKIKDLIFIPSYYNPELQDELNRIKEGSKYSLISIKELMEKNLISTKRGNEVGSKYYGMGNIPFIRTSDIANWEIRTNPKKSVPKEIYERYKKRQDLQEKDILLVADGTFLIGRTAITTFLDKEIIIQSHLRRIRCLDPKKLHPYLLLYLLNTEIVQKQIKALTFIQATISTIGNRLYNIILPVPKDEKVIKEIVNKIRKIINMKIYAKQKIRELY